MLGLLSTGINHVLVGYLFLVVGQTREALNPYTSPPELLADIEKQCDCGCEMSCIGDTRSEQLKIIPAKISVIVHVRKKYACKSCSIGVKQARMELQPIPKSIASAELLAYINIAKFEDYQPLYRQERILKRIGIDIPRATLSNWVIKSAKLLQPLYNLLKDIIHDYDIVSADETKLQVLREPGRDPEKQSYMWVCRSNASRGGRTASVRSYRKDGGRPTGVDC